MSSVRYDGDHAVGLDAWAGGSRRAHGRRRQEDGCDRGLRFAFYGRTSTADYQDRFSSCAWQREVAESVIAGHGVIAREFFDVGCSRRLPWSQRPQAAALLAELRSPDRPWDAVVVGEYERAFYADQFVRLSVVLGVHGVQVWLPEVGGPVDAGSPAHQVLVAVLGAQSQREVLRSRHRVLAAMQAQVSDQGRYLGGRPPYGYQLVDAGPHPNRAHSQWGRRLRRLDPDPATAPQVRWIFEQRLAGRSVASIARERGERGVACPSDAEPDRNRHRGGGAWTLRTVAVILANPRYTGRQVWNRQRTEHSGREVSHRTNPATEWTISKAVAHPALVSEPMFVAAQNVRAGRPTKDGSPHPYLLAGLVQCQLCGRRMDSHWVHGRAGYRCRHGHTSSRSRRLDELRNVYVREDTLLAELAQYDLRADNGLTRTPDRVASDLRTEGTVIVHDGTSWHLSTDA